MEMESYILNELRRAREHKNLTQAKLAKMMFTSSSTISRIERGVPIMWKNASHGKLLKTVLGDFVMETLYPAQPITNQEELPLMKPGEMRVDNQGELVLILPKVENLKEFARECQDILEEIRDGDYSEDVGQITIDIELLFSRWEVKRSGREPRKIVDLD